MATPCISHYLDVLLNNIFAVSKKKIHVVPFMMRYFREPNKLFTASTIELDRNIHN